MKKNNSYYFTLCVSRDCDYMDFNDSSSFGDEYDQYVCDLIDSADYIYFCKSKETLTKEQLQKMIYKSIENIFNKNSNIFDYDDFDKDEEIDEFDVSKDDIMFELQDIYDIETGRSYIPLIWGDDVWEDDDNYSYDNPPELWRMYIHN